MHIYYSCGSAAFTTMPAANLMCSGEGSAPTNIPPPPYLGEGGQGLDGLEENGAARNNGGAVCGVVHRHMPVGA